MSPTNTSANCIIDDCNFVCIKRVLALDISSVKHYVGYIKLFFFTEVSYNLLGHIPAMISKPLWYCLKWLGLIPDPCGQNNLGLYQYNVDIRIWDQEYE